jgi:hypothetical protein
MANAKVVLRPALGGKGGLSARGYVGGCDDLKYRKGLKNSGGMPALKARPAARVIKGK